MLMDLLGVGGIAVLEYLTYEVCRVDRRMCGVGVLGLFFVALAFIGRYVAVDRSVAVVAVWLAVVFVLLWFSR